MFNYIPSPISFINFANTGFNNIFAHISNQGLNEKKSYINLNTTTFFNKSVSDIIARIVLASFNDASKPTVIAVGGPGGTGKSTFSKELAEKLNAPLLQLDHYKTDRSFRKANNIFGPHPKANKMYLIDAHLKSINENITFDAPVYNKETGAADSTNTFIPDRINIIEGEVATYSEFSDYVDLAIYIDSDWKTQLNTRITRDIEERGYTVEYALETFLNSNIREFGKYGKSSKEISDIHVFCNVDYSLAIESITKDLFKSFLKAAASSSKLKSGNIEITPAIGLIRLEEMFKDSTLPSLSDLVSLR